MPQLPVPPAPGHIRNPPSAVSSRRAGWVYWPFRIAITIATVLLFNQAVFAGQFLSGTYASLQIHRNNATAAGVTVVVATLSAVLIRWPGRGAWWPIPACFGLSALIGVQIALGLNRVLAIHIPLGVAIIVLAVLLTVWSWRRHRPPSASSLTPRLDSPVLDSAAVTEEPAL
jgi:hypothetical protein